MGTKMGPSYANLFVVYIENQIFNQFNGTKPELYGRYIDDCIGATSSSREELDHFITSVNPIQTGLFSTFWDRGGSEAPPYVFLKPLTLWPPSLHRIVYALILTHTNTVMSL